MIITTKLNLIENYGGLNPIVKLKQYDATKGNDGKTLSFEVYEGAQKYSIPGNASVVIRATKPDLKGYEYPCSFSGNVVTVKVQEQMTVCHGTYPAELRFKSGDDIIGTANFTMMVEENPLNEKTKISETELPLLEQAGTNVTVIKEMYERVEKTYNRLFNDTLPYNTNGLSQLELELTARYETARNGKVFATKHSKFAVNPNSFGTRLLDSVGLEASPSTNETIGKDDFMQYLMFQWEHCNYTRDEDDGFARPTAIEGRPNFKNSGNVDVGSISATFWWKWEEDSTSYTIYVSDMPHPELGLVPWIEAVKADGSVLPYYIGSSYFSITGEDGLLHSLPNGYPAYNQSHNNQITNYQKKGKGYWGCGAEFFTHGLIFSEIKYKTANIQQYGSGCTNYNFQTKCVLAETATKRVLSKTAWSADVGSCVSVGKARTSDSSTDRQTAEMSSVCDRVRVKSIETVEISGTTYYALNLDVEDSFNTDTDTYVSSMPCWSGETDAVIGHYDGSNISCTNGRHTFRLHGREYLPGISFIAANCGFLAKDHKWYLMYAPKGMKHNTGLNGYTDGGVLGMTTDGYIGDYRLTTSGLAYPTAKGNSNAQGVGDYIWIGAVDSATDGTTRQFYNGGDLWDGGNAGLLYVSCGNWLGIADWLCGSRD